MRHGMCVFKLCLFSFKKAEMGTIDPDLDHGVKGSNPLPLPP